jgi:uncharacterized protein with PQ loop repeat
MSRQNNYTPLAELNEHQKGSTNKDTRPSSGSGPGTTTSESTKDSKYVIGFSILTFFAVSLAIECITNLRWYTYCNLGFSLYKIYGVINGTYTDLVLTEFYDDNSFRGSYAVPRCPELIDSIEPLRSTGYVVTAFNTISVVLALAINLFVLIKFKNGASRSDYKLVPFFLILPLVSYAIGFITYIAASKFTENFGAPSLEGCTFSWDGGFYLSIYSMILMFANIIIMFFASRFG